MYCNLSNFTPFIIGITILLNISDKEVTYSIILQIFKSSLIRIRPTLIANESED